MFMIHLNFETSLKHIQKKHIYTKEVDAYLVGKMVQRIFEEECDRDLFCDVIGMNIFVANLKAHMHEDPKDRASLLSIIGSLISLSYNFELPICCFC